MYSTESFVSPWYYCEIYKHNSSKNKHVNMIENIFITIWFKRKQLLQETALNSTLIVEPEYKNVAVWM